MCPDTIDILFLMLILFAIIYCKSNGNSNDICELRKKLGELPCREKSLGERLREAMEKKCDERRVCSQADRDQGQSS